MAICDLAKARQRRVWLISIMSSLLLQRLALTSRSLARQRTPAALSNVSKPAFIRVACLQRSYATNTTNAASPSSAAAEVPGIQGELESTLPHVVAADGATDWSRSYHGLSEKPFPPEVAEILMAPLDPLDVEIKPGK